MNEWMNETTSFFLNSHNSPEKNNWHWTNGMSALTNIQRACNLKISSSGKSVRKPRMYIKGILAQKQFCSKSQASVWVKLFQWCEVNNSLPGLNDRRFLSAILGFQIFCVPPCLFLHSLMGNWHHCQCSR